MVRGRTTVTSCGTAVPVVEFRLACAPVLLDVAACSILRGAVGRWQWYRGTWDEISTVIWANKRGGRVTNGVDVGAAETDPENLAQSPWRQLPMPHSAFVLPHLKKMLISRHQGG